MGMYDFICAIFNLMIMRFIRCILPALLLAYISLFSVPTWAKVTLVNKPSYSPSDTTDLALDLDEVIVVGYLNSRNLLQIPAAIQSIDPMDFNRFDSHSLRNVLNTVSGLRFEERAPASYRLSVRGSSLRSPFGIRNIKIYWNDFPLTEPTGSTFLNLLDPIQFSEAEVLKGPSGSIFGAGNGGAILFRSFPLLPPVEEGSGMVQTEKKWTRTQWSQQLEGGAYGRRIANSRFLMESNDVQVGLNWANSSLDGYREQSAMDRSVMELSLRVRDASTKHRISAHMMHSQLDYEIPGGLNLSQFKENPRQARPGNRFVQGSVESNAGILQNAIIGGVHWDWQMNGEWSQKISIFGQASDFENPFNLDYKIDQRISGGMRGIWTWKNREADPDIRWNSGFEVHQASYAARNYGNIGGQVDTLNFDDQIEVDQRLFFSALDWQFASNLSLQISQSFNALSYDITRLSAAFGYGPIGGISRDFKLQWVPRIGLNYEFNSNTSTYLSLARGFSPPTLEEIRTNEGSVNSELEAEVGTNIEWGFRGYFWNQRWFVDASFFYFWLKEAIVQQQTERGTLVFQNAGSTVQPGLELRLNGTLWTSESSIWGLNYSAAGNYYPFEFNLYRSADGVFDGNELTGVPKTQVYQQIRLEGSIGLSASLTHEFQSSLPLDDENSVFTDAHHVFNGQLAWTHRWGPRLETKAYMNVENITDTSYSLGYDTNAFGGRYYQPAPKRYAYGGIRLSWDL